MSQKETKKEEKEKDGEELIVREEEEERIEEKETLRPFSQMLRSELSLLESLLLPFLQAFLSEQEEEGKEEEEEMRKKKKKYLLPLLQYLSQDNSDKKTRTSSSSFSLTSQDLSSVLSILLPVMRTHVEKVHADFSRFERDVAFLCSEALTHSKAYTMNYSTYSSPSSSSPMKMISSSSRRLDGRSIASEREKGAGEEEEEERKRDVERENEREEENLFIAESSSDEKKKKHDRDEEKDGEEEDKKKEEEAIEIEKQEEEQDKEKKKKLQPDALAYLSAYAYLGQGAWNRLKRLFQETASCASRFLLSPSS
ncbi:hypothetical protein CSUI_007813, partial [Cystoisospora suis]